MVCAETWEVCVPPFVKCVVVQVATLITTM